MEPTVEVRAKTIDDQIEALVPLTPGVVAKLAGYARVEALSVKRHRGAKLTPDQLLRIAKGLRSLTATAEQMAKHEALAGPGALVKVLTDIVATVGGTAGDNAAAAAEEAAKGRPLRKVISAAKAVERQTRAGAKRRRRAANPEVLAEVEAVIAARPPSRKPRG